MGMGAQGGACALLWSCSRHQCHVTMRSRAPSELWLDSNLFVTLPGTIGFLVRGNDGFSFAVLANTRPSGDLYPFELKGVIDSMVAGVSKWPDYDLS